MMVPVMENSLYNQLASLLDFPAEDIKTKVENCVKTLEADDKYPAEALEQLKTFQRDMENISLDDLRGIYSYTFELAADSTLDLGYHLFDGFKRSNSLASIKAMYRLNNFPYEEVSGGELPDHLPVVLRFLGFVQDDDLKKDFRESFVIKAIEKLNQYFDKNKQNIYRHLVLAVYRVIDHDVKEGK